MARTHNFIIFSVTYQDLSKWLLLSQHLLLLPKCAMPPFPRSQVFQGCSLSPFWTPVVLHRKAAKWSQKGVWLACLLCALLSGLEIFLFHNSVIELVFKCIAFAILKAILIFRNYFLMKQKFVFPQMIRSACYGILLWQSSCPEVMGAPRCAIIISSVRESCKWSGQPSPHRH